MWGRVTRRARRIALAAAVTAGLAAAISAVVVVAPDGIGGYVPAANAEAAQVLRNAAAAAPQRPDLEPRPDQFVYQKNADGSESWMSVNGTRDGLGQRDGVAETFVFPGCRDGRRVVLKGDRVVGTEACAPKPAYLSDLPTHAGARLAYLNRNRSGEAPDANAMGREIVSLMEENYLRPQAQAALFEAAANVPGFTVIRKGTPPMPPADQVSGSHGR